MNKLRGKNITKFPTIKVFSNILLEVVAFIIFKLINIFKSNNDLKNNITRERVIVILEPWGLGDAITTLGMAHILKEKYPNHKTIALFNYSRADFMKTISKFDNILGVDFPWTRNEFKYNFIKYNLSILKEYKKKLENYDVDIAYDVRGDVRSQIFLKWLNSRIIIGFRSYQSSNMFNMGFLLSEQKIINSTMNRAQLNEYLVDDKLYTKKCCNSSDNHIGKIVVHFGAGWDYRLWKKEKWYELISRIEKELKCEINVVAPFEDKTFTYLKMSLPSSINFTITNTLYELHDIIKACDCFVGLDSGPMHLAAHLNKRIIALFGPGALPLWRPNCDKATIIHHQEQFECAPCLQNKCYHKNYNCMDAIDPDEVYDSIIKMKHS